VTFTKEQKKEDEAREKVFKRRLSSDKSSTREIKKIYLDFYLYAR
jgi:hypothetical protein